MIDGITILNEIPVYTASAIQYIVCITLFICLMFVADGVIQEGYQRNTGCFKVFCILLIAFVVFFISLDAVKPVLSYTKYEVIIDEKVRFTEFNDKYCIIKQEGLIYIIKEKD